MAGQKQLVSVIPDNQQGIHLTTKTADMMRTEFPDEHLEDVPDDEGMHCRVKRKRHEINLRQVEYGSFEAGHGSTSDSLITQWCNASSQSCLEWNPSESRFLELCDEQTGRAIQMLQFPLPATVARPIYWQQISRGLSLGFSPGSKGPGAMDLTGTKSTADSPAASAANSAADLSREAELLQKFYAVPSIDKAWTGNTRKGSKGLDLQIASSQINVRANSKVTFVSSLFIPDAARIEEHHWAPFPVELSGAALVVPSPSGSKLLVVRKGEDVNLEIWGQGQLLQDIATGSSVHGSVYADNGFEGVAWSKDEDRIAYIAEEAAQPRPVFGSRSSTSPQSDAGTWKGQGDWIEDWGETYTGKRRPVLLVLSVSSRTVKAVEGIPPELSVGQVVWSPPTVAGDGQQSLVFVGWPSRSSNFNTARKLGLKHCHNRSSALYEIAAPLFGKSDEDELNDVAQAVRLTDELGSAFAPTFSPDGDQLLFLSSKSAVDTGVHCSTVSLHSLPWPVAPDKKAQVRDVVPVVQRAKVEGGFPGLYCASIVAKPWLQEGSVLLLLLSSYWRSSQVILAVDVGSGEVTRITPADSPFSWNLHGVHDKLVIATASSPNAPAALRLGSRLGERWTWSNSLSPSPVYASEIEASLGSATFQILQVSVRDKPALDNGAKDPFEAILVLSGRKSAPLILVLHGGPHSVSTTSFSRTSAYLSALGFNLLHVNYRGSLGFGEQAIQSLPGKAGSQDVADVLAALDEVRESGLADTSKVAILGGSHGGFLATHLLGQAADRFLTAAVRNPVTNISSMVGITDIPDWCYVETLGKEHYTEAPSDVDLARFYLASPIAHLQNVKVPSLFLLGAQDRRVPISNGFQFVHALRQRGLEVKVIVFPEDTHSIDKPQSDFESFVNIGAWFKRFLQDGT